MERYKNLIERINYFAFLALLIALPFPQPIIHFCWLVWAYTWLLEFRYLDRTNLRRSRGVLYLSLGVGVWLVWNIVSLLWAHDTQAAWSSIERYISLLAIPLVGCFGLNTHYNLRTCVRVLAVSALASVGVYLFTHYWVMNHALALDRYTCAPRVSLDLRHMDNLLLDIKHRVHYANVLCLLVPCLVLLRKPLRKFLLVLLSLALLVVILWTGSRIGLVALALVIGITVVRWALRQPKTVKVISIVATALVLGAVCVAGVAFHPRSAGHSIEDEPRMTVWKTALEQPTDYLAYGLGAGNSTNYLVERYQQREWEIFYLRRFSPHNQFLGVCMDLGIVAAVLFVLFWIGIPWFFAGDKRYWAWCALGICLPAMCTEMILGGIEGIVFVNILFLLGTLLPDSTRQTDAAGKP